MTIKILDSLLREYLKTKATPEQIAEILSLTSFAVDRVEKHKNDFVYEIEITTNRPDLFSVLGIAKEASAVLPQFGISAEFIPLKLTDKNKITTKLPLIIKNDPKLVNRICAVLMEVSVSESSEKIKEHLETSGIRSLNNVIDVTNYVMRVVGHPTHAFDFDKLNTKELLIREGKQGEKITTLDKKDYVLKGGEIVAQNDKGEIVDLLGVMGLENSAVTEKTKRVLYFIDNNEPYHIRNASMSHSIRTEAATLNEKGIDPEAAMDALLYGIKLYEETAKGKQVSEIVDIYPNKVKEKTIDVTFEKINRIIGVEINSKKAVEALEDLGFKVTLNKESIRVSIPSSRANDMDIEEDVIEEIARIYGYHNLPSKLPVTGDNFINSYVNEFFWEKRAKDALKYWGFIETYTYSFVSENMYEGPLEDAIKVSNPLTEDFVYMRNSLIPSLLNVVSDNKKSDSIKIFEMANIYLKKGNSFSKEELMLSGVIKNKTASFYLVKGVIEQLLFDLGIKTLLFKKSQKGGMGSSVFIGKDYLGEIEVLDTDIVDFELSFEVILKHASLKKEYKPFAKYPPIVEDVTIVLEENIETEQIINQIKQQSDKIQDVSLKDTYKNSRTFHIIYQDFEGNLTNEEVFEIKKRIAASLKSFFKAEIK